MNSARKIICVALFCVLASSGALAAPGYNIQELPLYPHQGTLKSSVSAINDAGIAVGVSYANGLDEKGRIWNGENSYNLILSPNRTLPRDINSSGWIVGNYTSSSIYDNRSFLYDGKNVVDLGNLGSNYTTANGINNAGQVVGSSQLANGQNRAFLWQNGNMNSLATLGGSFATGNAINNFGVIAGAASNTGGTSRAVVWQQEQIIDLGTLGGADSNAQNINDHGQVTGYARTSGGSTLHAFLWSGNSMLDVTQGFVGNSYGYAVNESGFVVGLASPATGNSFAFLWNGNAFQNLNSLIPQDSGWSLQRADDINAAGQIVGSGWNPDGEYRAFLLTPVPEPQAALLLLAGLGLIGAIFRRRHRQHA